MAVIILEAGSPSNPRVFNTLHVTPNCHPRTTVPPLFRNATSNISNTPFLIGPCFPPLDWGDGNLSGGLTICLATSAPIRLDRTPRQAPSALSKLPRSRLSSFQGGGSTWRVQAPIVWFWYWDGAVVGTGGSGNGGIDWIFYHAFPRWIAIGIRLSVSTSKRKVWSSEREIRRLFSKKGFCHCLLDGWCGKPFPPHYLWMVIDLQRGCKPVMSGAFNIPGLCRRTCTLYSVKWSRYLQRSVVELSMSPIQYFLFRVSINEAHGCWYRNHRLQRSARYPTFIPWLSTGASTKELFRRKAGKSPLRNPPCGTSTRCWESSESIHEANPTLHPSPTPKSQPGSSRG